MKKNNEKGMVEVVIVFVLALLIGMAGGYTIGNNKGKKSVDSSSSVPTTSTKAADLRSAMVTLGLEHMALTNQAVDAALDGTKNAGATGAALYANGDEIAATVGSVYGDEAKTTFAAVWKLHLDEFVKYAVASSKGDTDGKQMALGTISTNYTKPLAAYLAKANPNLPEDVLVSALGEHVSMTAKMIDLHVAGDYTGEMDQLAMANHHIEGLFSTLAGAIVKQFPAKF